MAPDVRTLLLRVEYRIAGRPWQSEPDEVGVLAVPLTGSAATCLIEHTLRGHSDTKPSAWVVTSHGSELPTVPDDIRRTLTEDRIVVVGPGRLPDLASAIDVKLEFETTERLKWDRPSPLTLKAIEYRRSGMKRVMRTLGFRPLDQAVFWKADPDVLTVQRLLTLLLLATSSGRAAVEKAFAREELQGPVTDLLDSLAEVPDHEVWSRIEATDLAPMFAVEDPAVRERALGVLRGLRPKPGRTDADGQPQRSR